MTTRLEYVQLIANALVDEYGSTLIEYDTDIRMANAVFKALRSDLKFNLDTTGTRADYNEWKRTRGDRND